MRRWGAKRDGNEAPIILALRNAGYWVAPVSHPDFPDLVVGRKGRPMIVLMEVKDGDGKLTSGQLRFFQESEGCARFLVRSVEEALTIARVWIDKEGEAVA